MMPPRNFRQAKFRRTRKGMSHRMDENPYKSPQEHGPPPPEELVTNQKLTLRKFALRAIASPLMICGVVGVCIAMLKSTFEYPTSGIAALCLSLICLASALLLFQLARLFN
jgi:hypothetical protein